MNLFSIEFVYLFPELTVGVVIILSDIVYSVITSDFIKSFDCISPAWDPVSGVENSEIIYSSHMPICVCKFNNLHWKQSKFLLVLQHEVITMASRPVYFF